MDSESIEFRAVINNKPIHLSIHPVTPLVELLRTELQLTGTKISCGIGRCGACSVLMDGRLVNACLIMAFQANGKNIETIENLSEPGIHPIQQAMLMEGGFQCGYCTPGMVMAIKALGDETPAPTDEQILEALSGNLCRCTGYAGIIRAVKRCYHD
ncbi:(2Fe-2S)-binding protein [Peribacillus kribbensis]|uniref:(2Fe-2S)-binding protein n=1 Tax=Peribacillus kribbensis TaxID=356658 RepID=UPI000688A751